MEVANILDADAIKTSIATSTSAASYTGAALNGDDANPGPATPTPDGHTGVPQYPVAVGAGAGAFVDGSAVTFTGTYGGETTVRTATVVGANGGTFIADGPLDTCDTVDVEEQADTDGTWTFGFTDIGVWKEHNEFNPCRQIRADAAGVVSVVYEGGYADLLPFTTGQVQQVGPNRIVQATTTATTITLYR
jgi:hypothetical protein